MLYFYDLMNFLPSSLSTPPLTPSPPFMGIALPSGCSAISVKWQPKTNQIFCTTSLGKTRVFFDPRLSVKGAIITAGKAPKREKDPSDYALGEGAIFAPESLPMYKVPLSPSSLPSPSFSLPLNELVLVHSKIIQGNKK
jgi:hypothetical protein